MAILGASFGEGEVEVDRWKILRFVGFDGSKSDRWMIYARGVSLDGMKFWMEEKIDRVNEELGGIFVFVLTFLTFQKRNRRGN